MGESQGASHLESVASNTGQHGGEAIANILFGSINPIGKLPITFSASVNDLPRPTIPIPAPPDSSAASGFLVSFDLENAGSLPGAELAQVYLGLPAGIGQPPKRLVGWNKVFLQPGAQQPVTVTVDANSTSHPLS